MSFISEDQSYTRLTVHIGTIADEIGTYPIPYLLGYVYGKVSNYSCAHFLFEFDNIFNAEM